MPGLEDYNGTNRRIWFATARGESENCALLYVDLLVVAHHF